MGCRNNGDFFSVLATNFDVLALPLVALVYPLYASIKAIESGSRTEDQQQWLTYWVLYALIQLFEITLANLLQRFPIWAYAKLFAICWLVLPPFKGAARLYNNFLSPFYRNPKLQSPAALLSLASFIVYCYLCQ